MHEDKWIPKLTGNTLRLLRFECTKFYFNIHLFNALYDEFHFSLIEIESNFSGVLFVIVYWDLTELN